MSGTSIRRVTKIICMILNGVSFIAALCFLATGYYKFHLPGRADVAEGLYLYTHIKNDMDVIIPIVLTVYILFFIGFIGIQEKSLCVVILYGVIMYILAIYLFIYSWNNYGPSHYNILRKLHSQQKAFWDRYPQGETAYRTPDWERLNAIEWHHQCCGGVIYHDHNKGNVEGFTPIQCAYRKPTLFMTFKTATPYRMINRIGCLTKFERDYIVDLIVIRSVYFGTAFIWLLTGIFGIYYALLLARPREQILVVEQIRVG